MVISRIDCWRTEGLYESVEARAQLEVVSEAREVLLQRKATLRG